MRGYRTDSQALFAIMLLSLSSESIFAEHDMTDQQLNLDEMTVRAVSNTESFQNFVNVQSELSNTNDGADILKQTPGISLIRQGGIGSDPVLRGLGGTRLNIQVDGVPIGGVCNHRMDPATIYIKPGSIERLLLLKGPQSVKFGNSIGGAVNFERRKPSFDRFGIKTYSSYLYGSFNQQDFSIDSSVGFEKGYLGYTGNRTRSGNYDQGGGQEVDLTHYDTWSDRYFFALTPTENSRLEFSTTHSDGLIANATIHMDATDLDQDKYAIDFEMLDLNSWFKEFSLKYSYTIIDHSMDNFTLRDSSLSQLILMRQVARQNYASTDAVFELTPDFEWSVGMSYRRDAFDAMADAPDREQVEIGFEPFPTPDRNPLNDILTFENFAGYSELKWMTNDNLTLVGGIRGDSRLAVTGTMRAAGEVSTVILSSSNQKRRQNLFAGFLRGEYDFESLPMSVALGYGHAERAADYWEIYSTDGLNLKQEKNNELDAKLIFETGQSKTELYAFYSRIDDYILVRGGAEALNIDAERTGGEILHQQRITDEIVLTGELSYTYGQNLTQDVPLALTPPLEGSMNLSYVRGPFDFGFKVRMADRQTRFHENHGNPLSLDRGQPTPGFTTYSLQLGYQPHEAVKLKFGVDNLTDKLYTEHLNRNGAGGFGGFFATAIKVNEPGRTFWGRISIDLDYPG